jgi:adenylate cyclase
VGIVAGTRHARRRPNSCTAKLDMVKVLGKQEAVAIFEPLPAGDATAAELAQLGRWHEALARLRARDWHAAAALIGQLQADFPDDGLYPVCGARGSVLPHPPAADWDGVTALDSK